MLLFCCPVGGPAQLNVFFFSSSSFLFLLSLSFFLVISILGQVNPTQTLTQCLSRDETGQEVTRKRRDAENRRVSTKGAVTVVWESRAEWTTHIDVDVDVVVLSGSVQFSSPVPLYTDIQQTCISHS